MFALMQSADSQDATEARSTPPLDSADAVFARRLRDTRAVAGLTQQQLADRMTAAGHKMFRSQIGKIENGDRPVTISEATALADALGVTLADLATDLAATMRNSARIAALTQIRSLTEQIAGHVAAIHEQEVLCQDAQRRLDELKQILAELDSADEGDGE
jgi:transcriptional regulator with XRE-family HTH domain